MNYLIFLLYFIFPYFKDNHCVSISRGSRVKPKRQRLQQVWAHPPQGAHFTETVLVGSTELANYHFLPPGGGSASRSLIVSCQSIKEGGKEKEKKDEKQEMENKPKTHPYTHADVHWSDEAFWMDGGTSSRNKKRKSCRLDSILWGSSDHDQHKWMDLCRVHDKIKKWVWHIQ